MANSEKDLPNPKLLDAQDEESFSYAMQLVNSIVLSMALQSATELGVFDILQKGGPGAALSAQEIAARLSCKNPDAPSMLDRVLRLLASHSLLNCSVLTHDQRLASFQTLYSMAPVTTYFARNEDGASVGPLMTLMKDEVFLDSWSQLKDAIREGVIPFNRVHGIHAFEYPSLDSRFNQLFNTAMINHTTLVMKKVLQCYKGFEDKKRLVDVGGGLGSSINLITSKYPHIQGINFDLPRHRTCPFLSCVAGVEHVGGDMSESVPKGDAIFMKWILHDWSDEHCLKLLKNCYDAIPDDGKVIVMDAVLPIIPETTAAVKWVSQMDVLMMTLNT